jgi:tellurite resistance-related uncharacterized protein
MARPATLPDEVVCYRRVGPFDKNSLPAGLLREHRLKPGVWGVVTMVSGTIGFTWDDPDGGSIEVVAPDSLVIPPDVPHHVDATGPFVLEIGFFR